LCRRKIEVQNSKFGQSTSIITFHILNAIFYSSIKTLLTRIYNKTTHCSLLTRKFGQSLCLVI
jgi:hypothetical protein